jgi:hypothetical protein
MEEHTLRAGNKRALRLIFGIMHQMEEVQRLGKYDFEFQKLHCSPVIVRVLKLRNMTCTRHVA